MQLTHVYVIKIQIARQKKLERLPGLNAAITLQKSKCEPMNCAHWRVGGATHWRHANTASFLKRAKFKSAKVVFSVFLNILYLILDNFFTIS